MALVIVRLGLVAAAAAEQVVPVLAGVFVVAAAAVVVVPAEADALDAAGNAAFAERVDAYGEGSSEI